MRPHTSLILLFYLFALSLSLPSCSCSPREVSKMPDRGYRERWDKGNGDDGTREAKTPMVVQREMSQMRVQGDGVDEEAKTWGRRGMNNDVTGVGTTALNDVARQYGDVVKGQRRGMR
jgi:hypothetical protein